MPNQATLETARQVRELAFADLERRQTDMKAGQRARLRQLMAYREPTTEKEFTNQMLEGATPAQQERIRQLDSMPDQQRARLRQLTSYRDCETEACVTRRLMTNADPAQRTNIRQLNSMPDPTPRTRTTSSTPQQTNSNGRVNPSGMSSTRNHVNVGRPRST